MYETEAGCGVISDLAGSNRTYSYSDKTSNNQKTRGSYAYNTGELKLGRAGFFEVIHETFHAYQSECGERPHTVVNEIGAQLFTIVMSNQVDGEFSGLLFMSDDDYYNQEMLRLSFDGFNWSSYEYVIKNFYDKSLMGQQYKANGYTMGSVTANPFIESFLPK